VKHYASETGHTYSYWYRGWRPKGNDAFDYVFECRRDRGEAFELCVRLPQLTLDTCAVEIGRELTDTERYAVVKLELFRVFDEIESPDALCQTVVGTPGGIIEHLRKLGQL
jgi:hypothetical protein